MEHNVLITNNVHKGFLLTDKHLHIILSEQS